MDTGDGLDRRRQQRGSGSGFLAAAGQGGHEERSQRQGCAPREACARQYLGAAARPHPVQSCPHRAQSSTTDTGVAQTQFPAMNASGCGREAHRGAQTFLSAQGAGNWHPLMWLSHMLDAQLFGSRALGHHATSLLLRAANAVLLFLVLRRATRSLKTSNIQQLTSRLELGTCRTGEGVMHHAVGRVAPPRPRPDGSQMGSWRHGAGAVIRIVPSIDKADCEG